MDGRLPRRDLWLLPMISALTVLCMLAGAEVVARIAWPQKYLNECRLGDPDTGYQYRSNCSARMKAAEGPWYISSYNACGYRSSAPCGPAPAGTRRVALIGSSISEGYLVEYPDSIGARLEADLTSSCGAPVEVQNLGAVNTAGNRLVVRMREALSLHPDLVVQVILPRDLMDEDWHDPAAEQRVVGEQPSSKSESFVQRVIGLAALSRAFTVGRSLLFRKNPTLYVPLYMHNADAAAFLMPPFTPAWQHRLRHFEELLAKLATQAHASGVPFVLVAVPNQAQSELAAFPAEFPTASAEALPNALRPIALRHGAGFIDSLPAMQAALPAMGPLYYQVDGHPSGRGQPIIAQDIADHLVTFQPGPFADCRSARSALEKVGP